MNTMGSLGVIFWSEFRILRCSEVIDSIMSMFKHDYPADGRLNQTSIPMFGCSDVSEWDGILTPTLDVMVIWDHHIGNWRLRQLFRCDGGMQTSIHIIMALMYWI